MSAEIIKISANDDIFNTSQYLNDRLIFNYIEGARQNSSSEFYSDGKRVIIYRKKDCKSIWIWTDNDVQNDVEIVIAIARTVMGFGITGLEFFTKPNFAQTFSDMYALVSNDLDYQIKSEFSLGAYRFSGNKLPDNDTVSVVRYNSEFDNALLNFYMELKDEFNWSEDKVNTMVEIYALLNTYLLLKNSEIMSVCVIKDDYDKFSSIRSVATKYSERNKGYATILTNISSTIHSKNGNSITLYTNDGNISAVTAFKKAGFELVGKVHLIKS
ncbi:MAG: hypothetical protein IJE16_03935 [Ruminococcus sp.]|nr:hypothetical protein [Ruminococcus sp.]